MTSLINEKTIILSKLTYAFIYMLFHQMVALLCPHFVLSPQCYFTLSHSKKKVGPGSIPACRDRKAGERLLAMKPATGLERTAELFPACANSGKVHVKQNLRCCSKHFSSHSHKSHFDLVKWIFAREFFPQDLSLTILADEVIIGGNFI